MKKTGLYRWTGWILCLVLLFAIDFSDLYAQRDTVILKSSSQTPDTTVIIGEFEVDSSEIKVDSTELTQSEDDEPMESEPQEVLSEVKEMISFGGIFMILVVLGFTYLLNRLVNFILDSLSEKSSKYRLEIKRLIPVFRILLWILALYVIIEGIVNPSVETIITVLASVGIAVGFASQDILKNIFGGLMIILDRPFQAGDKIGVGDFYGEVIQIGLRSSRIVTSDDSIVTIPNGELMNKSVSNSNSSALNCQVVAEFYLPADTDVKTVKRIAYKAAISSRYIFLEKPIALRVYNEIYEQEYVMKVRLKAYVLDIRYEFPFKSDMSELVLEELQKRKLLPNSMDD